MRFKRIIGLLCVICFIISSSGCSLNFFSVESLMKPPTQPGENGEVQKAFLKLMGDKNIQLKAPQNGEYQTAFILRDLNGDNSDEAIVFYTDSSVDATVRMSLLECVNDTWVICADIKGSGNGVQDVSFSDYDEDGSFEIFVGWSLFDSKSTKIVSVYGVALGKNGIYEMNTLGNEYYSTKSFIDVNGDNKKDLVLIYLDDTGETQRSFFRCFSVTDNNSFVKFSEIELSSNISSVSKIQTDTVTVNNKKSTRVFIDCLKTDNTLFTEFLYWDSMIISLVNGLEAADTTTTRNSKVFCRDIDGDGLIEIPANTKLCGDPNALTVKKEDGLYIFTMLKWSNVFGDKSEGNVHTVFNPIDMYLYRVVRIDEVTVKYDSQKRALSFRVWDEQEQMIKDVLFTIYYNSNDEPQPRAIKPLYSSASGDKFYFELTDFGISFGVTEEGIKSSFIFI